MGTEVEPELLDALRPQMITERFKYDAGAIADVVRIIRTTRDFDAGPLGT